MRAAPKTLAPQEPWFLLCLFPCVHEPFCGAACVFRVFFHHCPNHLETDSSEKGSSPDSPTSDDSIHVSHDASLAKLCKAFVQPKALLTAPRPSGKSIFKRRSPKGFLGCLCQHFFPEISLFWEPLERPFIKSSVRTAKFPNYTQNSFLQECFTDGDLPIPIVHA